MKRFKLNRFLLPFFIYLFIAHILFFASPFAPSVQKTHAPTTMPNVLLVVEETLLPKPQPVVTRTSTTTKKRRPSKGTSTTVNQMPTKKTRPSPSIYKPSKQAKGSRKSQSSVNLSLPAPIEALHSKAVKTLPKLELKSLLPNYENKLTFFMQEALKLPKYGEVKVAITLHCSGKVIGVNVLEAQSDENKDYLLQSLPTLRFPPFPQETNEEIQTFTIRFFNS